VLNLGGIANVTRLPADPHQPVRGYDTGPANTLMDAWCQRHRAEPFDRDGAWAASARPDPGLLARLEAHPFFTRPAPKSTGRETFNLAWLDAELKADAGALSPTVVQSTLAELTARSIASALQQEQADEVVVGGGGVHNGTLLTRLRDRLRALTPSPPAIQSSAAWGLDPDWVEAAAFAWIARNTLAGVPSNLPSVTGASRPVVLGGIYHP
jgi:anhydro-N-acetylmuramic acid kinase